MRTDVPGISSSSPGWPASCPASPAPRRRRTWWPAPPSTSSTARRSPSSCPTPTARRSWRRRAAPAPTTARTQVPLVGRTQVIGVVRLGLPSDEDPDGYTANLTRLFASQVGNALEQFQLINRLNRAAHRDELTGTGNRRHADALLDSLRPGDALLIVDLDHFKSVNDNLGHRAGDEVLQALGSYLLSYVRGSDDVARYGGDEFVVLARGAGTEARATAERLLLGWRGSGNSTTISIGVALHRPACTPAATLDAADAALYRAKSQGRDQVALDATATTG